MAEAAELRTVRRGVEAVYRDLHRGLRRQPLHVREQFSARQGPGQLPGDLQRLQAALGPLQREREDGAVLEDRDGFLSAAIACSLGSLAIRSPHERSDMRVLSRVSLRSPGLRHWLWS